MLLFDVAGLLARASLIAFPPQVQRQWPMYQQREWETETGK